MAAASGTAIQPHPRRAAKDGCGDNGGQRVPGGKGKIRRAGNQKGRGLIDPAGARPGDQGLEQQVANQHARAQSHQQRKAGAAVLSDAEQDQCNDNPYGPGVAQQRYARHQKIQKAAVQPVMNPAKDGPIQRAHGLYRLPAMQMPGVPGRL